MQHYPAFLTAWCSGLDSLSLGPVCRRPRAAGADRARVCDPQPFRLRARYRATRDALWLRTCCGSRLVWAENLWPRAWSYLWNAVL